ncbi:hypothetical protein J5N97_028623 [Dioscorea zingiberensis]|uniref:Uncharacterized protein n=1 Tax=Dioscorea zingiberensis TaxID=325984 RepID=A0A9D5BYY6_9LILI|nr:hypothetical protein J5N97_028623 [Dioscorea zingiberensis]
MLEFTLKTPSPIQSTARGCRRFSYGITPSKAFVPTSDPETVFDIQYYTCDRRRDRPQARRAVLKKADVEKIMEYKAFDVSDLTDFPMVYLTGGGG